jgi:hypothetical protein
MNDDGGKEGKIHHGGNPVLTATALGAAVVPDVAGNLWRLQIKAIKRSAKQFLRAGDAPIGQCHQR